MTIEVLFRFPRDVYAEPVNSKGGRVCFGDPQTRSAADVPYPADIQPIEGYTQHVGGWWRAPDKHANYRFAPASLFPWSVRIDGDDLPTVYRNALHAFYEATGYYLPPWWDWYSQEVVF